MISKVQSMDKFVKGLSGEPIGNATASVKISRYHLRRSLSILGKEAAYLQLPSKRSWSAASLCIGSLEAEAMIRQIKSRPE